MSRRASTKRTTTTATTTTLRRQLQNESETMTRSYRGAPQNYSDDDDNEIERPHRLLMRPWLVKQLEKGDIEGLRYLDEARTLVSIPWRHGSRQGFNDHKDACLFERWAIHSGKYGRSGQARNAKRWKANFRCAMNSLPDVEEDKIKTISKGHNAQKVYRLLASKKTRREQMRSRSERDLSDEAYRRYSSNADRADMLRRVREAIQKKQKNRTLSEEILINRLQPTESSDYGSGSDDTDSTSGGSCHSHPGSPSSGHASGEDYIMSETQAYDEFSNSQNSSQQSAVMYSSQGVSNTAAPIPSVVEDIQQRDTTMSSISTEIVIPQSLPMMTSYSHHHSNSNSVLSNDLSLTDTRYISNNTFTQHTTAYPALSGFDPQLLLSAEAENSDDQLISRMIGEDCPDDILQSSSASSIFSTTENSFTITTTTSNNNFYASLINNDDADLYATYRENPEVLLSGNENVLVYRNPQGEHVDLERTLQFTDC